jgi:DNA-binding NtrC family response regulator
MDREDRIRNIGQWLEEVFPQHGMIRSCSQDSQPGLPLESIEESLAQAYLAANLRSRNIPLKEFMDDFEKRILVSCLRLAQGNQKNVAAVLSLKPTSLFEKLRKHGINPRRAQPRQALAAAKEIA